MPKYYPPLLMQYIGISRDSRGGSEPIERTLSSQLNQVLRK